jgi:anti-sigma regulatory factor (Ser/Thr protein kinase)
VQRERAIPQADGGLVLELTDRTTSVTAARHAFATWLQGLADDETVNDMTVVLSELASNATAGAAEGSASEVRASVRGDELRLEVTNAVGDDDVRRWDLDDPLRGGGRGLLIVRAYTDAVEIETAHGSVTVCCVRRLG